MRLPASPPLLWPQLPTGTARWRSTAEIVEATAALAVLSPRAAANIRAIEAEHSAGERGRPSTERRDSAIWWTVADLQAVCPCSLTEARVALAIALDWSPETLRSAWRRAEARQGFSTTI